MCNDLFGNLYCIGQVNISTNYEFLIVKYDSDGTLIWNSTWGGVNRDYGYDIEVNKTNQNEIFCTGAHGTSTTELDMALIKMDSLGNEIWNRSWNKSEYDVGYGIAFDVLGNIYIVGSTWITADGFYDLVVVKFNSTGHEVWNTTWGGNKDDQGNGIVVVGTKIYVVGYTHSYPNVGTERDMVLLEFDTITGAKVWNVSWGGSELEVGYDICMDSQGNITCVGSHSSGSNIQAAVVKFNLTGGEIWNTTWNTANTEEFRSLKLNYKDEIYCGGQIHLGGSDYDYLVCKFDADGNEIWNTTWGRSLIDGCLDILIDEYTSGLYAIGTHQTNSTNFDMALVRYIPNNDTFIIPANVYVLLNLGSLKINISANVSLTLNTSLFNSLPQGLPDLDKAMCFVEILVNATNYEVNTTIRFHYNEDDLPPGITEEMLDVVFLNGSVWESLGATVNTTGNYIEVSLNHFSFYAIVGSDSGGSTDPPTPPIPGFETIFIIVSLFSVMSLVFLYQKYKSRKVEPINF